MKSISNHDMTGVTIAYAYMGSVLPGSAITLDQDTDGNAYLYAIVGNDGPAVAARWDSGWYVDGRVGERQFTTQQGFVNAVMRATARP